MNIDCCDRSNGSGLRGWLCVLDELVAGDSNPRSDYEPKGEDFQQYVLYRPTYVSRVVR